MKPSRLLPCALLAALTQGVFLTSVQAAIILPIQPYQDALPDFNLYTKPEGGHNSRWDFLYWSPTTGAMVPDWSAHNWARYYDNFYTAQNPVPPIDLGDRPFYAVFSDSWNFGPASGFKTVNVDADSIVRGVYFRNQGWIVQDTGEGHTITLTSGDSYPYNSQQFDDREAITMYTGAQATLSVNVVLGTYSGSSSDSDGSNQYVAMGAHSALTISGNISETGAAKTLNIGTVNGAGLGSALTLAGNNTFTGGVVFNPVDAPYDRTLTPRLNLNSAQALGTGTLTIIGGPAMLGNTSGAAVTITNPLVIDHAAGTTGNAYNRTQVVADVENLIFDGTHDLTLTSDLTLTAHRSIRVEAGGGDLILGGRILSDGSTTSSLFKNGPGTLVLSATDSTYTGVTQINGGILEVTHLANAGQASSIGAGANTIAKNLTGIFGVQVSTSSTTASGSGTLPIPSLILSNGGTLRYVGTGDNTDRLIGLLPGQQQATDPVAIPVSIDASGTGALKFTNAGAVVHIHGPNNYRILNLTGTNTDDNTFNLALTDSMVTILARNQLTKSGTGKWILSGTNTHTGGTTVYDGTLQLGDSGTVLADTGAVIVNGGTFRLGAANETIGSLGGTGGTVDLFNGTGRTLTFGGTADANYAGAIVGAGGSLVKTGAATQTLSGANSYTGTTAINVGTLRFAGTSAFYDGTIDSTTAARLTVASGATAGFNIGGAGEFTSTHLDTLRVHGNFAANSFLGLDLSNAPGGTFTYASDIDGVLGLAKLGAGTLVLSGVNSYTGPTAVRDGTLAFSKTTAFSNGTIDAATAAKLLVASGATAQFNVGGEGEFTLSDIDTLFGHGGFAAGSSLGLDTTNTLGGTLVYASNLDGQFGLTKAGSGTLLLAGANTYSGPTTVTGGTLLLNDAGTSLSAATDVIVTAAGTLQLGASDQTIGSLAGDGTVQLRNVTGRTLTLGGSTTTNFGGTLAGAGGSLVKAGSGRQTLSGTNTYDGATAITGGTLQFAKTSAFYNGAIDATTAARLSVASGGTAAFSVGGTGEFTSPHLDTILGHANFAAGSVLGLDPTTSSGGTFTYAGNIGGGIGLAKLGTGTLVLSGANSYTGATTVGGGTLQFAKTSAFYGGVIDTTTAAKLSLTSGSTVMFNYGGEGEFTDTQINTLHTSGAFTAGSFLGFDTTNAIGGTATYETAVRFLPHGLIKAGSGTLVFNGEYNDGLSAVSVLDGTLHITWRRTLFSSSTAVDHTGKLSVAPGATATVSVGTEWMDFTAADLTKIFTNAIFESGSTLGIFTKADIAYDDVIAGAFRLGKFGDNTLTLSAPNRYTGGTLVAGGTLQLGIDDALGRDNPTVTVAGGILSLGIFNQRVGAFTLESGEVTGSAPLTNLGTLTADSFDLRSGFISANLSGPGAVTKSGTGTVVFNGRNDYTGTTTISGGSLHFTAASTFYDSNIDSTNAAKLAVGSGATAHFNLGGTGRFTVANLDTLLANASFAPGSNLVLDTTHAVGNLVYASNITNPISLAKSGPGNLILSGMNSYTGATLVTGGALRLGVNDSLPSTTAVTVSSGASFDLAGYTQSIGSLSGSGNVALGAGQLDVGSDHSSTTFSGDLSGVGGRLTKTGTGTLTLSGTNTYTGGTTVNAGTLTAGSTGAFGSGSVQVNGGTLDLGGHAVNNPLDVHGGTLTGLANYAGTQTLSAAMTYSGTVGGALIVASGGTLNTTGAIYTGTTIVQSNGQLSGSGRIEGLTTLQSGAHLAPGNSPGTLTFTGGLTLNTGSILDFELGTASDLIVVSGGTFTGPASLGGITVNLTDSGSFTAGTYTLIDATGASLSSIGATSFELGQTIAGYNYEFAQNGNLFQLIATNAVPEPATAAALAGLSVFSLAALQRRRA